MKAFVSFAMLATVAAFVETPSAVLAEDTAQSESATVEVKASMMLYGPDGKRIARVYSVSKEGDPQLILDADLYTVPASTLSIVNGKLTTSMTKREITSGN